MPDSAFRSPHTTAAAWMDRLSDRLGSLIPGGSRWPPRHPVKVSLTLGGLGLLTAWCTLGLFALSNHLVMEYISVRGSLHYLWAFFGRAGFVAAEVPKFSAAAVLLNVLLAIWMQQGRLYSILCFPFIVGAHFWAQELALFAVDPRNELTSYETFFFGWSALLPVTLMHTLAVALIARRRLIPLFATATVIPAAIGSVTLMVLKFYPDPLTNRVLAAFPYQFFELSYWGTFFGMFYSSLGICLGIPLWDVSPRPRFELPSNSPSQPLAGR